MAAGPFERLDRDMALKRNFMLSEKARSLVSQMKFYEAISLLEEIEDSVEDASESVKLLECECYIQLGREIKAGRIIEKFKKMILARPAPSISVIESLADVFDGVSCCVRAMILRKLIGEMYLSSDISETDKFDGMFRNLQSSYRAVREIIDETKKAKMSDIAMNSLLGSANISSKSDPDESEKTGATQNTIRLFTIAMDYGIGYMLEMFEDLEQLRGIEGRKRARELADCANAIGYLYCQADEPQQSIKWRKRGMRALEDEFGNSASDYQLYGDLHHNVGVCLYNMHKFSEAEQIYLQAIDIYYKASDYGDEAGRERDLGKSRSDLKDTRKHLIK